MATNTTVTTGKIGAHDIALTATQVDTVTFADDLDKVVVTSDGAAALFFTVDGSTPTVGGQNTYELASAGSITVDVPTASGTVVKLISSGTPKYSVTHP